MGVLELREVPPPAQRLQVEALPDRFATWAIASSSSCDGSPPALRSVPCNSPSPALEESLKQLSALVTYLRTCVDCCVATHPLATKKMKPKTTTRRSREPIRVIQAGSVLLRRLAGLDAWSAPKASDGGVSGRPCEIYALYETPKKRRGRGGTRTPTASRPLDPEPSASTNSATRPQALSGKRPELRGLYQHFSTRPCGRLVSTLRRLTPDCPSGEVRGRRARRGLPTVATGAGPQWL